jgi:Gas vesicle synthesis protein GvpO
MAERQRSPANTDAGVTEDQPRLSAAQAGREGLEQITELTGKEPESVTGVKRSQDGWLVTVEVVEDRRIPSSTDILSTYEAEIDNDGELLSYRRVRRYSRGSGDDGNG